MKLPYKMTFFLFLTGVMNALLAFFIAALGMNIIFLMLSAGLCSFFMAHLGRKMFAGPITKLYDGVKIVRSGNLDYKVDTYERDETGDISRAFDRMSEDLIKAKIKIENLESESEEKSNIIKELRKREEYFRSLFEHSNDAVFINDFDGRIIDANEKACLMLGYSKTELLTMSFLDLHTEEELTRSKSAFKIGAETCSVRFESKFRRLNGTDIFVAISSSVVDLKKGIMQAIVSDISSRKDLERALRDSEEKFRSFMESARDFMYIADEEGRFIYTNSVMRNTLGYTEEEIPGMNITDLLSEGSREEFETRQYELIAEGEALYETVWETKNRVRIHGEMRVSAIYDNDGTFSGSRGIFRDITDRKKIEESQRLAQLGKLAADVAHEVNNPITIISGRAQLSLMEESDYDEAKKNFKIIIDQCELARSIVKRLLLFSKPAKRDFKEININDCIDLVAGLLDQQFVRLRIRIEKDLCPSISPVKADEKQIQEVFMNLMINAADAMPEGGTIIISTSESEGFLKVSLRDTGCGISPGDMKKIFDPFFTTKEKGTGLGLSMCYGIVKEHNGELVFYSEPGKGTTANIIFPVSSETGL
ncbi:MAG: PAS domain S-box protein [Candidatus Omnitrophota bacterium]